MAESVTLFQLIVGVLAFVSAAMVVFHRNPVVCAMSLMSALFLTGGLYLSLGATFLGAAQILIYAGAIAVLIVFIVMLLDQKATRIVIPGRKAAMAWGAGAAGAFAVAFFSFLKNTQVTMNESTTWVDAQQISFTFLTKYMLAFQMTGFLILAAVMGVVILGKPRTTRGPKEEV